MVNSLSANYSANVQNGAIAWNRAETISGTYYPARVQFSVRTGNKDATTRNTCARISGQVRVCDYDYGATGWSGQASAALDSNGHITGANVKINSRYVGSSSTKDQFTVGCHEMGHALGLPHSTISGSCMVSPYTTGGTYGVPTNELINLINLYNHTDSYNSYNYTVVKAAGEAETTMAGASELKDSEFGIRIEKGVFEETWIKSDGKGGSIVTHLTLAPGFENLDVEKAHWETPDSQH